MAQPVVAIVGRPNVGKSTLFNYLAGERIAIVADTPGITRDRIYADVEWLGRRFTLIDTGGIEPKSEEVLLRQMRRQAELAIETADVILFMVDVRNGLMAADHDIATMLRKSGKPVVVAINKADHPGEVPLEAYEFYNLGLDDLHAISAEHALGIGDLLDAVTGKFPPEWDEDEDGSTVRVAIVGRPNVGKSSLLNRLTGEERAIVSDISGTTRDAIDSVLETEEGRLILIDTAGLRRKAKVDDDIERYSTIRAVAAIDKADVCLLMIDGPDGPTDQDSKIAGLAHNRGKASIFVVNKWDLVDRRANSMDDYVRRIRSRYPFMEYAPVLFLSAKTGSRVDKLIPEIRHVYDEATREIKTGVLNDLLGEAQAMVPAPHYKGRRLKISYATQVATQPPTFVLFVNDKELLHFSYERYLENQVRRHFDFAGSPIRFILRNKHDTVTADDIRREKPDRGRPDEQDQ